MFRLGRSAWYKGVSVLIKVSECMLSVWMEWG